MGELAALGTACCWAGSALFFEAASVRVGSLAVNLLRMPVAIVLLAVCGQVTTGHLLPLDAGSHAWLWLTLSGIVGFVIGDICLFRAFVVLGPRLSSLTMSTSPLFAAALGWVFLGEELGFAPLAGMILVIAGIAWALLERMPAEATPSTGLRRPTPRGVLLALGGAVGQATGLVIAKHGMGTMNAFSATLIRVIAATVSFAVLFALTRQLGRVLGALRDRRALALIAAGAAFGPFLGVGLSLLAVQHTDAGIAAALMATTPILLIPLTVVLHRDRVGLGGVAGAFLAVAGVALLFQ